MVNSRRFSATICQEISQHVTQRFLVLQVVFLNFIKNLLRGLFPLFTALRGVGSTQQVALTCGELEN